MIFNNYPNCPILGAGYTQSQQASMVSAFLQLTIQDAIIIIIIIMGIDPIIKW